MLLLAYSYYSPTHYTKGTITHYALFDNCIKIQFSRHCEHFSPFPRGTVLYQILASLAVD